VLSLFRANTFFRNFEIKGPADRVLIYGILFVSEVLGKIKPGVSRREAEKVRYNFFYMTINHLEKDSSASA
jgi:actin related protein 2/3 complex subunit 3